MRRNAQFFRCQMVHESGMRGINPDMKIQNQSSNEFPSGFFAKDPELYWTFCGLAVGF